MYIYIYIYIGYIFVSIGAGAMSLKLFIWPDGQVSQTVDASRSDDYFIVFVENTMESRTAARVLIEQHFGDTNQMFDVFYTVVEMCEDDVDSYDR